MKILLAGGAGFVGTNVIQFWQTKYPKDSLIVLDNFLLNPTLNRDSFASHPRVEVIEGDVRHATNLQKIFETVTPDCVINLIDGSNTPDFLDINFYATANLLQASKSTNVSHFVHASPANVYGIIKGNTTSPHRLIHELDSMIPYSPQQVSKAAADMLTVSFWEAYKLPVTVLRFDYMYGPYEAIDRMIPLMITNALRNRPIPIHVDVSSERNLLFVADGVSAFDTVLQNNNAKGKIYNVSAGVHATVIELAETILTIAGRPKTLISVPADVEKRQTGTLDTTLFTRELKWEPKYSIDLHKRLEEMIEWYKENKSWWEKED